MASRLRGRWARIAAITLGTPLALAACRGPGLRETVIARLAGGNVPRAVAPWVTIGDETRDVLAAPRAYLLARNAHPRSPDGRVRLRPPLPPGLAEASRVLVTARVKGSAGWIELPSQVIDVDRSRPVPAVPVVVAPPIAVGASVPVDVRGIDVSGARSTATRHGPFAVPAGARLRLATGFVGHPEGGTVSHRIEACTAEAGCRPVFGRDTRGGSQAAGAWQDASVDLSGFAGKDVTFVFTASTGQDADGAAAFPVWGDPVLLAARPAYARSRSVLLVSIDTLGARHVTPYGYAHDTTPFLSRMAREGVLFEHLGAAATHTLESHLAMMTGLSPTELDVHGPPQVLDPLVPTIAELLRDSGYRTAAFTEDGWVGSDFGFSRGFEVMRENRSADLMTPEGHVADTFQQAARWLEGVGDDPFFAFVHTYEVHHPYAPPAPYRTLFRDEADKPRQGPVPGHVREAALYDEEIRHADDQLRRLWQRVEDAGLADRTVLVVTSDHGEAFMEHGWQRHASYPYEEQVHVPLLMLGPGVGHGMRVPGQATHGDLFMTIAELAGLKTPPSFYAMSLVPFLSEASRGASLPPRVTVSETWSTVAYGLGMVAHPFPGPAFAATRWPFKLVRYTQADGKPRYDLFDLGSDPGERRNLWPARQAAVADLRDLLDRWQLTGAANRDQRRKAAAPALGQATEPAPAPPSAEPAAPDPAISEKLKALGYTN